MTSLAKVDKQLAKVIKGLTSQETAKALYGALCDILDSAAEGDPRLHPYWHQRYNAALDALATYLQETRQ